MIATGPVPPTRLPGARPVAWRSALERVGWSGAVLIEVVALLVAIEWSVRTGVWSADFIPAPSAVAEALGASISTGQLTRHLAYSLQNFLVGYVVAVVVAVVVGFAMGRFRSVDIVLSGPVWTLYSTPKLALAPLIVLWIGLGRPSNVLLVFLLAVFPMIVMVMEGFRSVNPSLLRAGAVFGARGPDVYTKIVLPAALPFIVVALRIGVARGMVGMVVGEFLGASEGLGLQISLASRQFHMADAFAYTVVVLVLANASLFVLGLLKRWLAPWDDHRAVL
jgi:NitT/TauT family transport system permease protein